MRDGKAMLSVDNDQVTPLDAYLNSGTSDLEHTLETTVANERHRIRIDYADAGTTTAKLKLQWDTGSGFTNVPGANLAPDFGLPTSGTDPDGKASSSVFSNPHTRLLTSSVADSSGLALTTTFENNGPSNAPSKKTLPSGSAASTTYTYWGDTEDPGTAFSNPCSSSGINQGGRPKTSTGPTPATGSAITKDTVYDAGGRVLGTRTGSDSWTCYTYDVLGRISTRVSPSYGGESGRTVTYTYAVSNNPLVSSVSDPAGNITTTIDLLGRTTQTVDVWNKTRTVTYDQAGHATQTTGPEGTQTYTYNDADQVTQQTLDSLVVANVTYDTNTGRPLTYASPSGSGNGGNGTLSKGLDSSGAATTNITYDTYGRSYGIAWYQPGGSTLITSDFIKARALSGRLTDRAIDGTDARSGGDNYQYDAAGRLTNAWDGSNAYVYDYTSTACGANTNAGKNPTGCSTPSTASPPARSATTTPTASPPRTRTVERRSRSRTTRTATPARSTRRP